VLIREYLSILWPRKSLIIALALVCSGAALLYTSSMDKVYTSEAEVLVNLSSTSADPPSTGTTAASMMQTEAVVATSTGVAQQATEELDTGETADQLLERVTVEVKPDTNILNFAARGATPGAAQAVAAAFANSYLDHRQESTSNRLAAEAEAIQSQIDVLNDEIAGLNRDIESSVGGAKRTTLEGQVASLGEQVGLLQERLIDTGPARDLYAGEVIRTADRQSEPANPSPVRMAALGLLGGLTLGVALAFVEERMRDRLRRRVDLENQSGAPVLAVVPKTAVPRSAPSKLVTESHPQGGACESYRTLRTGLLMAASRRPITTVMITSPSSDEGKTTAAANLGVVLAQAGKRTIVLSADLRRPQLHRLFEASAEPGLTNVLAGEVRASEVLQQVGVASDNLRLLPPGPIPNNPAELLGSEAMQRLMSYLRDTCDFVLVDTPPLLDVADAAVMASTVDAVLLVASADRTTRADVLQARKLLDQVDANLIGTVLNRSDSSRGSVSDYLSMEAASVIDAPLKTGSGRTV
jgi:succinoglycan biosynthesis transport protein ExoP